MESLVKRWVLYIEPVAQGRPRACNIGGHIRVYTPAKTRHFREALSLLLNCDRPARLAEAAVKLTVRVYRAIPRSKPKKIKKAMLEGKILPTTKPDLDNYIKAIKDSMKGVAWLDDSQVVQYGMGTGKYYGQTPRIEITVEELPEGLPDLF